MPPPLRQACHWMLTVPVHQFLPYCPPGVRYIRGQLERGAEGFVHWQLYVVSSKKISLAQVREIFGPFHCEATRSSAARDYVWKEETSVPGTKFELGTLPFRRSEPTDWALVKKSAETGDLASVPADVYVRCYNQLKRICSDNLRPIGMERVCYVFWGATGTGKSRDAWNGASMEGYPKDPNSKFWDGYRNHENVVIDEFRGGKFLLILGIAINHLLRWLDRYPCIVEVKGSSVPLCAKRIWITSNLDPRLWYADLDEETKCALLRRLTITHYQ